MRKMRITIEDWETYFEGRLYLVRVADVQQDRDANCIVFCLEHLDAEQQGRCEQVRIARPIRPAGLGAQTLNACGLATQPGTVIAPADCIGRRIRVAFERDADTNAWHAVRAEPEKETSRDAE